ncbi:MAG: hypothetical protein HKN92_03170 [Chitinophagales bacterium]|nr:hypothetical protein [Chitinophagales bacterium]
MERQILFLFLFCLTSVSFGQSFKQYEKKGNEAYDAGDHYKASKYFKKALELKKLDTETYFKYATSLRLFNDYKNAATAYKELLRLDNYRKYPSAEYWLGIMNKYTGNYDIAYRHLSNFSGRYELRNLFAKSARHEIENIEQIEELLADTADVGIEHLNRKVNTKWSDFAATSMGDSMLQISSLRPDKKDSLSDNNLFRSRFYAYEKRKKSWDYSADFFSALNDLGKDVANGTFGPDGEEFYFTVCDENEFGEIHCKIFKTYYRNKRWDKPRELAINLPCCTSTHPSIERNGDDPATLYFASDRAGSVGGMDIWYSVEDKNGNFTVANNLGEQINTIGDEITPFYDIENQNLVFSSNWHMNLGGYDIFYSQIDGEKWSEPINLGVPFNTSYNDIYFSVDKGGMSGYLSSNRPGSFFLKGETCCNDVYSWKLPFDSTLIEEPPTDTGLTALIDSFQKDTAGYSIFPTDTPLIAVTDTQTTITSTPTTKQPIIPEKPSNTIPDDPDAPDDNINRMKTLLPVTLYFHNDEPECCTMKETTNIDYKTSYQDYASRMPEYIKQYSKLFSDKEQAKSEMEAFFETEVDKGMIDLIRFSSLLQAELESGKKISVTIEGYCSPLAVNPYNINLAKRRIVSLKDYFNKFRKGIFKGYLASGQLIIEEKPFGEERADSAVSDDPSDVVNSIYHIEAALERKVEIIAVDVRK